MISYDGSWRVMQERGISRYALIKQHHIKNAEQAFNRPLCVFCPYSRMLVVI